MSQLIEQLEGREFLSVSPVAIHPSITVTQQADLQAIANDRTTLANDRSTRLTTLANDRVQIPTDRRADNATIASDRAKIIADRGNPSLVAADEAQLRADRAKLVLDVQTDTRTLRTDSVTTYRAIVVDLRQLAADQLKYRQDVAHNV